MKKKLFALMIAVICGMTNVFAQSLGDKIVALIPSGKDVYRYGYNELSDEDKKLYDSEIESLCHFEANKGHSGIEHRCDLTGVPSSRNIYSVMYDLKRIQHDVPEMYILSTYIPRSDYSTGTYYARITSVNTPEKYLEELQKLNNIANEILKPIKEGMSDYEKLKIIHDGFINWGDYGDMTGGDAGNIRGALINKRAVCEGFARAGLYLCQKAGLKCIYVEGQLRTSTVNDTWGNHAWNFVQLDDKWYLMDLTSDGGFPGVCGYTAFLRGQDYFSENYKLTSKDGSDPNLNGVYKSLPSLASTTYDPVTSLHDIMGVETLNANRPVKHINDEGIIVIQKKGQLYNTSGARLK